MSVSSKTRFQRYIYISENLGKCVTLVNTILSLCIWVIPMIWRIISKLGISQRKKIDPWFVDCPWKCHNFGADLFSSTILGQKDFSFFFDYLHKMVVVSLEEKSWVLERNLTCAHSSACSLERVYTSKLLPWLAASSDQIEFVDMIEVIWMVFQLIQAIRFKNRQLT